MFVTRSYIRLHALSRVTFSSLSVLCVYQFIRTSGLLGSGLKSRVCSSSMVGRLCQNSSHRSRSNWNMSRSNWNMSQHNFNQSQYRELVAMQLKYQFSKACCFCCWAIFYKLMPWSTRSSVVPCEKSMCSTVIYRTSHLSNTERLNKIADIVQITFPLNFLEKCFYCDGIFFMLAINQ